MGQNRGLHGSAFRIERITPGPRACTEACEKPPQTVTEPESQSTAVREVSAALAYLAT